MNPPLYVHYGCGLTAPPGWVNFDASPTLRIQRVPVLGARLTRGGPRFPPGARFGDVVDGLPVPAGSCAAVYCSHVLEHLALDDFRTALRNTFTYLEPGGVFRLVVPDMERLARDYLASREPQPVLGFLEASHLGRPARSRGLRGLIRDRLGNSAHLWMWDYRSIRVELERTGFTGIRRAEFGDAEDPMFREVEHPDRWAGCLGVECRRPAEPVDKS